ncbi:HAD family hydrolase [Vibrio quintilis]|uniref:Pyrimidine 5'-nucleotidase YjjG n=1 Tax=Vibrio quintilis TaxID=1117707 RepID=A0A1M7YST1_9VIBR|nr:HAD-IA family hydrolase [Vibrio quintilis]SHO55677.1 Pyrimidine 5'-nucleotidase YjjG [Vibrio quintilis]
MIRAVYFDLDNTLVERNASIDQFSRIFIRHFSRQLLHPSFRQVSDLIKQTDNGGYLVNNSPYQRIYQAIGAELALQLGWHDPVPATELEAFWKAEFPRSAAEMPGAAALIRQLVQSGYHVGIISNGAEWSRRATLAATTFGELIQQLVSSERFGVSKPDPSIFTDTARAAGFSSGECIYIGDHPEKDIRGAMNAGMQAVYLSGFHPDIPVPDGAPVIHHLSEVMHVIESIIREEKSNPS